MYIWYVLLDFLKSHILLSMVFLGGCLVHVEPLVSQINWLKTSCRLLCLMSCTFGPLVDFMMVLNLEIGAPLVELLQDIIRPKPIGTPDLYLSSTVALSSKVINFWNSRDHVLVLKVKLLDHSYISVGRKSFNLQINKLNLVLCLWNDFFLV